MSKTYNDIGTSLQLRNRSDRLLPTLTSPLTRKHVSVQKTVT